MAHVWNILNTIQIVNTFPLFSLSVPENVKYVLVSFNRIANLQVVPKEDVYNFLEKLLEPEPLPGQELTPEQLKAQEEKEKNQETIEEEIEKTNSEEETSTEDGEADGEDVEETLETKSKKQKNFEDFGMNTTKVI